MAKYKIIPSSRTIVQSPISIGHKAEKGVEAIEFDLTAWVETYGSGTATIIMRRWGDAIPYPIALEIDENNKATWTLSDTDTAKAGMAYAQLSYIVGDEVVKKSDIYTFRVMDSLTGEGDPPEAYESWLEHLTHFAAEAMAEVLDIEGIVTDKTLTVDGGIADAKATGDALSALEDAVTEETDKLKADLANLYPVKSALVSSLNKNRFDGRTYEGQLTSTGSLIIISSQQWVTTDYIYVGDLTNIIASCKNLSSGNRVDSGLFYLCTYDSECNFIEQVGSIYTGQYTVESGVSYIRFSYQSDRYGEIQVESGTTKSAYEAFDYETLNKSVKCNDKALSTQLCKSLDNTSLVDITEDFTLSAGYINKNNGNFVSSSSAETTDFINIMEYVNLYVSGSPLYSSNCLYAVYDESKVFLGAYKQNTTETDYHFSFNEIKGVYPSAQFVRFSSITTGSPLTIKRPSTLAELFVDINPKEWTGKKWVCIGDSLTEQNSRTTKHYFDYVADSTGISVVNMGLSGSGYAKKADTEQAFYQRISAVPTDADVITIFGSGNDMSASLEVGTPSDTGTTTLCGCINTTIDNLYAVYPLAVLGIVTPTPWLNTKPSDTSSNFYLYCQAIKQICANRGIPCLDLFHESGLRPWQESFRQLAYSKDDSNGVHPDETGHKLIAPRFKAFLATLLM